MNVVEDPADDPRVIEAAREYLLEIEARRKPSREVYYARHPELASAMEECFDGIDLAQALQPAPPPPPLGEFKSEPLGDYRIVREIGRGGMGVVYEAIQLSLGRRVALKVLPFAASLDQRQLQRFKTEAHAAAQLHHANIVPVHGVGCERGVHFYAMQLIEGQSLERVIKESRAEEGLRTTGSMASTAEFRSAAPVKVVAPGRSTSQPAVTRRTARDRRSYRTAARIAAEVADALDYAHESGVVHRDVKPANLILDASGRVWVTDFGLAQVTADVGLTQTGDVLGTWRYMSPEQAAGRKGQVDHRTDVYSLGATLYELLTLEPIFNGGDRQTLLFQILHEEPKPPRSIDKAIPVELETIVLKATAKSPGDRYSTAGELAADLRRFLEERPILARRPTLADSARKWMRRHPSFVVAGLLLLLLSVAVMGVSYVRIAEERRKTADALDKEKQRAKEADERFELARRAADDMILIAEDELADNPFMENLRKRLLESALAYYQKLIEQRAAENEPQGELAVVRDRVRQMLRDLAVLQGGYRAFFLKHDAILNDLEATREQRAQLDRFFDQSDARNRTTFEEAIRLTTEERRARFVKDVEATEAAFNRILSEKQLQRLAQIRLQSQGVRAFREPEVVQKLGLTSEQRERMRTLLAAGFFPRQDSAKRSDRGDAQGAKKPENASETYMKRALEALTEPQRKLWSEMVGRPFTEFHEMRSRQRRPPGQNGTPDPPPPNAPRPPPPHA